jgi:hypothetical protein
MRKTATRVSTRRHARLTLDTAGDIQTSYFFMLNCLLHARVHTGIESNSDVYDEDVNVYLAHLLNSHMDPKHIAENADRIALHEPGLHELLGKVPDDRRRFEIYRANADYLLMAVSVFDRFEDRHCNRHPAFHVAKEAYIGKAATYYALASAYAAKLGRGANAIAATLRKLGDGIDNYVKILSYMRGQYLGFIRKYSPGELFHLDRAIEEIKRSETIEEMRNEFLDTYRAWRKSGRNELKARLVEQARLLKELDPTFEFKPPNS